MCLLATRAVDEAICRESTTLFHLLLLGDDGSSDFVLCSDFLSFVLECFLDVLRGEVEGEDECFFVPWDEPKSLSSHLKAMVGCTMVME